MEQSKERFSKPQLLLLAIIVASIIVLPGTDIYTHIHDAWLYNHMIKNHVILTEDISMLSGHDKIYGYGIPAYALAGAVWFIFQKSAVKVLEAALFAGVVLLSARLFRNRNILVLWYSILFASVLLLDSYPYFVSLFLFYLGLFLIRKFKDKPYGDLSVILASINHPYFALSNIATIFLGRMPLFLISLVMPIIQFVILKDVFFAGIVNFQFENILHLIFRSSVLFFPFIAEFMPKLVSKLANIRIAYIITIGGILIIHPLFFVPFQLEWKDAMACYYGQNYAEIPNLPGNIRVVDTCREWTYIFPLRGMVTSQSSEFQGQYLSEKWTEPKYLAYLQKTNTSYVVYCRDCKITTSTLQKTAELEILSKDFPIYENLSNYIVFNVSDVQYIRLNITQKNGSRFFWDLTRDVTRRLHNLTNTT